jgi:hypothetical protein
MKKLAMRQTRWPRSHTKRNLLDQKQGLTKPRAERRKLVWKRKKMRERKRPDDREDTSAVGRKTWKERQEGK